MRREPFAWEASYPAGVRWDTPLATYPLTELMAKAATAFGERAFIDYRGATLSFAALADAADRFAAALLRCGLGRDSGVALLLPNTPVHPIAFLGALKAGARVVHLSPLDAPRVLAHKLTDSGARTLVTLAGTRLAEAAVALHRDGLTDRLLLARDFGGDFGGDPDDGACARDGTPGVVNFDAFVAGAQSPKDWPAIEASDLALLQYTGGTTGLPKGAMLTHANLAAATESYQAWYEGQRSTKPEDEIVVGVLPLFHIYALTTVLLRQLRNGGRILLHPRFDADAVLDDISVRRATTFPGVPTMWTALAYHPDFARRDLSSLRVAASGGAPLPVEIGARIEWLTGLRLKGGWGMTETAPAGTNLPLDGPGKPGSIGLPMPGVELDIVSLDDPARVLGPGETGELRVRGLNVTSGYWNRPEETAASFVDDRLLTGDIGFMDEDGWFFIVDRKKDMIISGGFNVYPQMIEQAIYEHPDVEEVLVVGVPDGYRGEAAKAFVKLKAGAAPFDLEALKAFLADRLGRHEMPAGLEFREALPRTPVGKLSKRRCARRHATHHRAGFRHRRYNLKITRTPARKRRLEGAPTPWTSDSPTKRSPSATRCARSSARTCRRTSRPR